MCALVTGVQTCALPISRLRGLPPEQRLAVLAEWDVRCESGSVHNAIAYLYGLIKKAVEGVFKLWAARKSTPPQTPMQAISNSQIGRASCRDRVCQYV